MLKKFFIILAVLLLLVACKTGDEESETPYADRMLDAISQGKIDRTKTDMRSIGTALGSYLIDHNALPETMHINDLANKLRPAYMVLVPPNDGWGRKLVYTSSGNSYQLTSFGADGQRGTADDIVFSDGRFIQEPTQ